MSKQQNQVATCAWHSDSGSSVVQAAAIALLAAALIAALSIGAVNLGPAVDRAFDCLVAVLSGGDAGCAGGGAAAGNGGDAGQPAAEGEDKPWWEDAWGGITDGWNWFSDNVLQPIGDAASSVWDWLWQEHEATWWKDFLGWLKDKGPLGLVVAGILGFAADLLFGLGMDGKFSWGMVIFATATTILSFFGVGLLAKIPVLGKLFAGGGALSRLGSWLLSRPLVQRLINSRFGQWAIRFGTEGLNDLLHGRFGTILTNLGHLLGRVPIIGPLLLKLKDSKIVKTAGNYLWTLLNRGPIGLVGDVIKTIIKDILRPAPGTPLEKIVEISKRLFIWKALRDIIKWLQNPWLPF